MEIIRRRFLTATLCVLILLPVGVRHTGICSTDELSLS